MTLTGSTGSAKKKTPKVDDISKRWKVQDFPEFQAEINWLTKELSRVPSQNDIEKYYSDKVIGDYSKEHHADLTKAAINAPDVGTKKKVESGEGVKTPPECGAYSFREMTLDDVAKIYDSTIVMDRASKLVLFLNLLCNFTDEGQTNTAFTSVSASGKTYIALAILALFPEEDTIKLLYASPKSFFHQYGELVLDDGETPLLHKQEHVSVGLRRWEEMNPDPGKGEPGVKLWREDQAAEKTRLKVEWDKIPKGIRVSLERKIIVFLDQPHYSLLETLRPVLSHDEKMTVAQFADKDGSGSLNTKRVFIIGYPSVVHLSTRHDLDEQEGTRCFLLSASVEQEKLKKSIRMLGKRKANQEAFDERIENDPERIALAERIMALKLSNISEVRLAKRDMKQLVDSFLTVNPRLRPRHQRDFPRLLSLVYGHALLNFTSRTKRGRAIYANHADIEAGRGLYREIAKPNEMGLSPALWDFWKDTLKPALKGAVKVTTVGNIEASTDMGLSRGELRTLWWNHFGGRISDKSLVQNIEALEEVNLIEQKDDPEDRRRTKLYARGSGGIFTPPSHRRGFE